MKVHLVDGTYELFRHFYALPQERNGRGEEIAAVRGVVHSLLGLIEAGATHLAVATDHVIESFRNDLWPGYKDATGIDPDLFAQFPILEASLHDVGIPVWPMVEYEADDGLASGAAMAAGDERVEQVLICTPDKDLAQCVVGSRVVQFDRRQRVVYDDAGVREKFGIAPTSIPDYLALVGDSADGFPGIKGWGAKSSAAILDRYLHLENIPPSPLMWDVTVRGAKRLAAALEHGREDAKLFRTLATLVSDAPIGGSVDDLAWRGPSPDLAHAAERLAEPDVMRRAQELAAR